MEMLPFVTRHSVEVMNPGRFHILQIRIERQVVLVDFLEAVAAVVIVCERIGAYIRRLLSGREVHPSVGVDTQIGEEVELIIDLEIPDE